MSEELEERPLTARERWQRRGVWVAKHSVMLAFVYVLIVIAARSLHRRVLYQPPEEPSLLALAEGATILKAQASDGVAVHAIRYEAPNAARTRARTVVVFHGNAETAESSGALARLLLKRGLSVVVPEYRGYGRSRPGTPTEDGLYRDAEAVLDALVKEGIPREQTVLWGQSLGGGVAVEMAKRGHGSRLVLVAPFTSTVELASRIMPVLPAPLVMLDRFDNLAKAPQVEAPALIVHGDRDDVIPMELGERLARAFPKGRFVKIDGGHHNDLYKNASALTELLGHASGG